jgi:hypothetical protein
MITRGLCSRWRCGRSRTRRSRWMMCGRRGDGGIAAREHGPLKAGGAVRAA